MYKKVRLRSFTKLFSFLKVSYEMFSPFYNDFKFFLAFEPKFEKNYEKFYTIIFRVLKDSYEISHPNNFFRNEL